MGDYKTLKDDLVYHNVEPVLKKKIEFVKSDKPI